MAKKPKPVPVLSHTTAVRLNDRAVRIELVLQPKDAAILADQIVSALVEGKK